MSQSGPLSMFIFLDKRKRCAKFLIHRYYSKAVALLWTVRAINSLLHGFQLTLSCFVILTVATRNVYLCSATVVGGSLGCFAFNLRLMKQREALGQWLRAKPPSPESPSLPIFPDAVVYDCLPSEQMRESLQYYQIFETGLIKSNQLYAEVEMRPKTPIDEPVYVECGDSYL